MFFLLIIFAYASTPTDTNTESPQDATDPNIQPKVHKPIPLYFPCNQNNPPKNNFRFRVSKKAYEHCNIKTNTNDFSIYQDKSYTPTCFSNNNKSSTPPTQNFLNKKLLDKTFDDFIFEQKIYDNFFRLILPVFNVEFMLVLNLMNEDYREILSLWLNGEISSRSFGYQMNKIVKDVVRIISNQNGNMFDGADFDEIRRKLKDDIVQFENIRNKYRV